MIKGVPDSTDDVGADRVVRAVDLSRDLVTLGKGGETPVSADLPDSSLLFPATTSVDPLRLAALSAGNLLWDVGDVRL